MYCGFGLGTRLWFDWPPERSDLPLIRQRSSGDFIFLAASRYKYLVGPHALKVGPGSRTSGEREETRTAIPCDAEVAQSKTSEAAASYIEKYFATALSPSGRRGKVVEVLPLTPVANEVFRRGPLYCRIYRPRASARTRPCPRPSHPIAMTPFHTLHSIDSY